MSRPELPVEFLRATPQWARQRRHFWVEMIPQSARSAMLRDQNRLWDKGVPPGEIRHEDIAEHTLRTFFLPLFNEAGSCILHGRPPNEVASEWPGFNVVPHELGWEIVNEGAPGQEFPFWNLAPTTAAPWGLLLSVECQSAWGLLEHVLRCAFNPVVIDNPQSGFRAVYTFAKKYSRSGRVWLDYNLQMTRIEITASGENSMRLYETALRIGNIEAPYWGLRWSQRETGEN